MTPSTPSAPAEQNTWQHTVDSCSHYLLTHGVSYHQAVEYFRRSLLTQAKQIAPSVYKAAKLAGVSRTMYYRPGKSFAER